MTFAPDYAAGTITLKPEFFAEVNDGSPWCSRSTSGAVHGHLHRRQDRDGGHRHHRLTASSPVRTVAPGCYVPAMPIRTNRPAALRRQEVP